MPEGIGYAMPQASPLRNTNAVSAQKADKNTEPPAKTDSLKAEEPPKEEKDFMASDLGNQIDYSA